MPSSSFLSVNDMLGWMHYCVLICSLENTVREGAVIGQVVFRTGFFFGAGGEVQLDPKEA